MGDSLGGFSRPTTPQSYEQNESGPTYQESSTPPTEVYMGAAKIYGQGKSFMDQFDAHEHAHHRSDNLFYPFASKQDWEIASWLCRSNLSMNSVDEFLSLELVRFYLL